MEENYKVAEEVAINDVKEFVEYHLDKVISYEKVKDDYSDVVLAVQRGLLTFDEKNVPTLTLKEPIQTESGSVALSSVTFKTRLVASKQAELAKGVDMKADLFTYLNKVRAFYISQSVSMLDKFGKFDFKVIDQLVSVF